MKRTLITCALLLVMNFSLPLAGNSAINRPELKLDFLSSYESNIFHSFADSLETGAMVNFIDAQAKWRFKTSRKFRQEVKAYLGMDYYSAYTQRNRSSFGASWKPTYRYNHKGRFIGLVDISRRNRDLITDSGISLTRTFKKTVLDFELTHRYKLDNVKFEQTIAYVNYNYDEFVGLTSYDYSGLIGALSADWDFANNWNMEAWFSSNKRNYLERTTYTISLRTSGPSEIRAFRENIGGLQLQRTISENYKVWASAEYVNRRENFENFYGYSFWQYRVGMSLKPTERLMMRITARLKNKDYPNYWTGNIGSLDRVYVDYTEFKFKGQYALNNSIAFTFSIRSYTKDSNDPGFAYSDLTVGAGFSLEY